MPYATPAQYLAKYGHGEATQLLSDEQRLLTEQLLRDALAGTWTGTPSQDEQDAATAALARLQRALEVASSMMDGYLRSAVTLPLPPSTAQAGVLEDCCCALARCDLADDTDNATERMDAQGKTWRSWLADVAAGRVHLVDTAGQAPASVRSTRSGVAATGYDWTAFGGVQ